MSDPHAAGRAREWLERQLAELGHLRNASRRDPGFKAWRQQTLTVIQRIWSGDIARMDRFRRIPFSPPSVRSTERQAREFFERGLGEAGVVLRDYLAEIERLGLSPPSPETGAPSEIAPLTRGDEETPAVSRPPSLDEIRPDEPGPRDDEISRAMERLLSSSPVFRGGAAPAAPTARAPEVPYEIEDASDPENADAPATESADASTPEPADAYASELLRVAGELEALGLPPARAGAAREALIELARSRSGPAPDWALVREAISQAAVTPALARRLLPLLLPFADRAA